MIPKWVDDYIGLPYKPYGRDRSGIDCWGLIRIVLAEQFGISVPSYAEHGYRDVKDAKAVSDLMIQERVAWQQVWLRTGNEYTPHHIGLPGDVLLLRMRGRPMHVGLIIKLGWMLHIDEGHDSVVENYLEMRWRNRSIGIYRFQEAS